MVQRVLFGPFLCMQSQHQMRIPYPCPFQCIQTYPKQAPHYPYLVANHLRVRRGTHGTLLLVHAALVDHTARLASATVKEGVEAMLEEKQSN